MTTTLTLKDELSKVLQCSPAERASTIIDSPYTREILEELSAQEAYLIIKDCWGSDSQILLQYVPPETICHFIDMDCWEKDSISVENLLEWLWEIYNASVETLQDALEVIDLDLVILLFQSYIEVVQVVPTDENISDLLNEGYESVDDIYYFRFTQEDEKIQLLKDMLNLLFTNHHNIYYGIMQGVVWELKSTMEESIYERRTLRLMEMGFPPPDEAMSIYQRIKPDKLLNTGIRKEKTPVVDEAKTFLPALYREHFSENRGLIVKTLEEISPENRDRFVYEMIYLANKITMADYKPLNEVNELKTSIDKATSIASLGLAVFMKEHNSTAHAVVENINAETLFSLGYNMILEQQQRLKSLLREIDLTMIPQSLSEYLDGLLKKRPRYKDSEFSCAEQLEQVRDSIDRIEAMALIMAELGWKEQPALLRGTNTGTNLDMETILLTSIAVNFLDKQPRFRPLSSRELQVFVHETTHMDSRGLRVFTPAFKDDLPVFLGSLNQGIDNRLIRDVSNLLTARFEEEISAVRDLESLDPRFITCFVVQITE